jgi:hypothetical protein
MRVVYGYFTNMNFFIKKCVFKRVPQVLIRLIISLQLNFLCTLDILTDTPNEETALQIFPYNL